MDIQRPFKNWILHDISTPRSSATTRMASGETSVTVTLWVSEENSSHTSNIGIFHVRECHFSTCATLGGLWRCDWDHVIVMCVCCCLCVWLCMSMCVLLFVCCLCMWVCTYMGVCVCDFECICACVRVYRWRASVVVFQGHVRVSAYFKLCVHQCVSVWPVHAENNPTTYRTHRTHRTHSMCTCMHTRHGPCTFRTRACTRAYIHLRACTQAVYVWGHAVTGDGCLEKAADWR